MKRRQRNNKGKNNYNDQKDVEAADDNDVGKYISTYFVKNQNTYLRLLFMVSKSNSVTFLTAITLSYYYTPLVTVPAAPVIVPGHETVAPW